MFHVAMGPCTAACSTAPSCRSLDLTGHGPLLGPFVAGELGRALQWKNRTLTALDLDGNRMCGVYTNGGWRRGTYTAEGINAIADAIRVSGSLTAIE